jgi:SulP family sulfate permease
VDLVVAVNIGVILALLQFLRRMSAAVEVPQLNGPQLDFELGARGWPRPPPGVLVYSIEGPLFFGAVDNLERALAQTHSDPRALVIRLGRVPFMDITGIQALAEAVENLERRGVRALLCEANRRVLRKLVRAGLVRRSEKPPRYYRDLGLALAACTPAVALAEAD